MRSGLQNQRKGGETRKVTCPNSLIQDFPCFIRFWDWLRNLSYFVHP
jgi:hypothetical protein